MREICSRAKSEENVRDVQISANMRKERAREVAMEKESKREAKKNRLLYLTSRECVCE